LIEWKVFVTNEKKNLFRRGGYAPYRKILSNEDFPETLRSPLLFNDPIKILMVGNDSTEVKREWQNLKLALKWSTHQEIYFNNTIQNYIF